MLIDLWLIWIVLTFWVWSIFSVFSSIESIYIRSPASLLSFLVTWTSTLRMPPNLFIPKFYSSIYFFIIKLYDKILLLWLIVCFELIHSVFVYPFFWWFIKLPLLLGLLIRQLRPLRIYGPYFWFLDTTWL